MNPFRRAACRLFTTPAAAASSTPVRSSRNASHPLSQIAPPHAVLTSQLGVARRWNSQTTRPKAPVATATATPEDEQRMIDAAVQFTEGRGTSTETSGSSVPAETESKDVVEEGKRAKRLRLLNEAPTPKETVYVGNLFYDVTAEDLRKQMEKYGVVEQVFITFDNRGISRGFGYVQFDTTESAKRAINAMNMRVFEGRRVVVQYAQNNAVTQGTRRPASRTLYIGNMSFETTDRDLHELFRDIVNVIDVRVSVERRTGQFRGFAHAEFINVDSARTAYEILSRKTPHGRKLRIDYSETNRRADRIPEVEEKSL